MLRPFSGVRLKVLVIRSVLGIAFSCLLTRIFFPDAQVWHTVALAAALVFFSYAFEASRNE